MAVASAVLLRDLLALPLVDSRAHFLGPVLHLLPGHLLAVLPGHRHAVLTGHLSLHGVLHSGALLLVHVAGHGAVLGGAVLLVGGVAVLAGHLLAVLPETQNGQNILKIRVFKVRKKPGR